MEEIQDIFHFSNNSDIKIVRVDTEQFDDSMFAEAGIYLPENIKRAVVKRRREYFWGRLLAKKLLSKYGCDAIVLKEDVNRCPIWPTGVVGSISHDGAFVACATKLTELGYGLGIDVQQIIAKQRFDSLKKLVFSQAEWAILLEQPCVENSVTAAFSAKESIFKGLYPIEKEYFGFECVQLLESDSDTKKMTFMLNRQFGVHNQGEMLDVCVDFYDGYVVTYFDIHSICV